MRTSHAHPRHASPASEARPPSTGWPSWSASWSSPAALVLALPSAAPRIVCAFQNHGRQGHRRRGPGLQLHRRATTPTFPTRRPASSASARARPASPSPCSRSRAARRSSSSRAAPPTARSTSRSRAGARSAWSSGRRRAARCRVDAGSTETSAGRQRQGRRQGHRQRLADVGVRQPAGGQRVRRHRRQQRARRGAGHQPDHRHRPAHLRRRRGSPDPGAVDLTGLEGGARLFGDAEGGAGPLSGKAEGEIGPPIGGRYDTRTSETTVYFKVNAVGQAGRRAAQVARRPRRSARARSSSPSPSTRTASRSRPRSSARARSTPSCTGKLSPA